MLAVAICLFTVAEVNYPRLSPQSQLALFAMLGLLLCFLGIPIHRKLAKSAAARAVDGLLALLSVGCCSFIVVQTEPLFERWWLGGQDLGNRAGQETSLDTLVGVIGLLLVIEATRRAIGWALPVLAVIFLAYAWFGPSLPDWLFPHRGYGVERIVAQTFLHGQGVFGTALRVMFTYVFLFVIFGTMLQASGATQFIIDFARRVLGASSGGPAKVAVLSSGMMGSLSGSAVANTATTGTFTIPMMRSAGFRRHIAAGVEAAASSGGALVPPVMGAGAYMMLEIVEPPVTYLQIIKAALLPAILYYVSLLLIVHLYAKRTAASGGEPMKPLGALGRYEGFIFVTAIGSLIGLLAAGYTVFRSVTLALALVVVVSLFNPATRITPRKGLEALVKAGRDVVPLVSAAACVGVVLGVVTLTGIGTKLPTTILRLAQDSLIAALVLIMISSIILGMGLPSAVCYLLMATLIGPIIVQLDIVPLAAHLFIFYFGMMSMVTPPVALAGYAAGSIAGASIMRTSFAAFRFALVGFSLPYMFVFRPQLLMLDAAGEPASWLAITGAVGLALLGLIPLAASISGYLFSELAGWMRGLLFVAAILLLLPSSLWYLDVVGFLVLVAVAVASWFRSRRRAGSIPPVES